MQNWQLKVKLQFFPFHRTFFCLTSKSFCRKEIVARKYPLVVESKKFIVKQENGKKRKCGDN
ncbi:unnamed protein product [Brassica oleracea var. botrytis]